MIYNAHFIKYKESLSLDDLVNKCNMLQQKGNKKIPFYMNSIIQCNYNDICNLLQYGKLPEAISGMASFSCNGVWHCIGFTYNQLIIVVYTGEHNTPLYISIL